MVMGAHGCVVTMARGSIHGREAFEYINVRANGDKWTLLRDMTVYWPAMVRLDVAVDSDLA